MADPTVCFYAGLNAVALVWIFLWVPETKGLTLEELDRASTLAAAADLPEVFSVKTLDFDRYQMNTWLPWIWRRYVCRDKDAYLKPLVEKSGKENWDDVYSPPEKMQGA